MKAIDYAILILAIIGARVVIERLFNWIPFEFPEVTFGYRKGSGFYGFGHGFRWKDRP